MKQALVAAKPQSRAVSVTGMQEPVSLLPSLEPVEIIGAVHIEIYNTTDRFTLAGLSGSGASYRPAIQV